MQTMGAGVVSYKMSNTLLMDVMKTSTSYGKKGPKTAMFQYCQEVGNFAWNFGKKQKDKKEK